MISFEESYKNNSKKIKNYIRKRVRNFHDAEDIFQTVFLKFHIAIRKNIQISNLKCWLYSVAENTIGDWIRYEEIRPAIQDSKLIDLMECPVESDTSEESNMVHYGIEQLNYNYQEVLNLRYGSGLGIGSIADKLGISNTNTKVILHRSKNKLRKLLN